MSVKQRAWLAAIGAVLMALGLVGLVSNGAANAAGNNGTLKIHEEGTPSGTESNDPKVCRFNVEGYGLDSGQAGYLYFDTQGGDSPTGTPAGPFNFGPANANGYYETQYFSLDPGHYKATLYGKSGRQDEKAKSKVFKVQCAPPVDACPDLPGNQPVGTDCNPPTDACPNIDGNQPPGTDCNPPEEPEGSNNSSSPSCETINIGMPTNVKPAGATVEVYLDDVQVTPGVPEPASAGLHTVKTYVNDVLVDTDEVMVQGCDQPPLPDLVTVAAQESDDPCNPVGVTNNVTWKAALPSDTQKVTWTQSNDGLVRTAVLNLLSLPNLVWADNGETDNKVFTLKADSGEKCAVDSTPTVTITPTVTPSPTGSIGTPVVATNTPSIKKTPVASPTVIPPHTGAGDDYWPGDVASAASTASAGEFFGAIALLGGAAVIGVALWPRRRPTSV